MNIALILSGGSGKRLKSDIPKQYIKVGGKPIISYCFEVFANHAGIDAVHVVAGFGWYKEIRQWMEEAGVMGKFKGFSVPGENRQLSIWHALRDIVKYAADDDKVLVHDAARPMLSGQMVSNCLDAIKGHDGVIPVLPMKDTLYKSRDGKVVNDLLERDEIYAGQVPELFYLGAYYKANRKLPPAAMLKISGTMEPAIKAGLDIAMIPGDEKNIKITTQADLDKFRQMIEGLGDS